MEEKNLSRRGFLVGTTLGVAGLSTLGLMGGCSAQEEGVVDPQENEVATDAPAETVYEADVAVVGVGMAGLVASVVAANQGAKVIGIDRLKSFSGANHVYTSGMWVSGSSIQAQYPSAITEEEAFKHMYEGTNYQSNAKLLRKITKAGGKAADLLWEYDLLGHPYENLPPDANITLRGIMFFTKYYDERGDIYEQMIKDSGVEMHWSTQASRLIFENDTVVGVRCLGEDGESIDVKAKAVIVSTGGFIQNKEMVAEYFSGAKILGPGNVYCDGTGIKMCQEVNAQIGKNFSASLNESGGANEKAQPPYPLASPGFTYTNLFSFPLFGGLCVDRYGIRFIDESLLAESMMFAAEPINRESSYYCIFDNAFMERLRTELVSDVLDPGMYESLVDVVRETFEGKIWSDIDEEIDEAINQGWAWKAESIEELSQTLDMEELPGTTSLYNEFCEAGRDDELFKDGRFLAPILEPPFYCVHMETSAWMTIGGIKCDQNCQALDKEGEKIPGLYVAGGDADLWATPYYQGGSACGFGAASGYIAAEDIVSKL